MSRPLPRFTQHAITTDPLEHHIAAMRAREEKARAAVQAGHIPDASPEDARGVPIIAPGVPGTSPGTHPLHALLWKDNRERKRQRDLLVGGTSPHTDPYLQVQHWPER